MGLTLEQESPVAAALGAARARKAIEEAIPILEDWLKDLDPESADANFARAMIARYREVLA